MDSLIQTLIDILRPIGITEPVFQFMLVSAMLGISMYLVLATGMFSLANAGFMAIGAYTAALLTTQLDFTLWQALIVAMAVAALIAVPIGLPVLRLRDIYLAIATIGFGEVLRIILLNIDNILLEFINRYRVDDLRRYTLFGGGRGIRQIPVLTETSSLLIVLFVLMFLLWRLGRSRFGRAMAAIRQDEKVAANMGINVVFIKNGVFVLSAMVAALAGGFNAHLVRTITPDMFDFDMAVDILAFAVLGGMSTWVGPIVGGLALTAMPEVLRFLKEYRGVFNGLVLLLVIVYVPGGLINPAGWRRIWRRARERLTGRPTPPAEEGVTDAHA